MKRLLTIDAANYTDDMVLFEKHTVRAIIEKDGKYSMQQSGTGEYKIPGGGVEKGESHIETIKREVLEETGLIVKENSIREIGEILELRKDIFDDKVKYVCHSYFYFCDVEDEMGEVCMTQSEIDKGFHPVWATAREIVETNRKIGETVVSDRDTAFIELLLNNNL